MHLLPSLLVLLQDTAPAEQSQNPFANLLLPMVLVGGIFWFLVIAPERRKRKQHDELLSNLSKGDKVMTNGGIFGTVAQVHDDVVTLQISDGVRVRFSRHAIQGLVGDPKPDAKADAKDEAEKAAAK